MTRTFESPSSYQASYSLLGRAVRAWTDDRLRGQALFFVVLTGLTLGLLMIHYLGWALLKPVLTAHSSWQMLFWGGQVVSVLLLAGVGLVGFRPAVRVTCTPDEVRIRQGDRSCHLAYDAVNEVEVISARLHHRHYRRYARTRIFRAARTDEVILLRTDDGPVIVGMRDRKVHAALLNDVQSKTAASTDRVAPARP